jgi:hypothetical protein
MLNLVQHLTEYLSFKSKILKRQSPQVKQVVLCNSGTMRSILEGLLTSQAPPLQAWRDQSPGLVREAPRGWGGACRAGAAFDGQTPPLRRCAAPPLP